MENSLSKYKLLDNSSRVTRVFSNKTNTFDNDIEVQKEYLQKLKTQRSKTEKLYLDYMELSKEREVMKHHITELRAELDSCKTKYESEITNHYLVNRQLQKEIESLNGEIRSVVNDKAKALSEIKIHYQTIISDLSAQTQEQEEVQVERQTKMDKLASQLQKREKRLAELEDENEKLQVRVAQSERRSREEESRLRSLAVEKEQYDRQRASADTEREKYRQQLHSKDQLLEKLKRVIEESREKERLTQKSLGELQQSKNYWNSKIEEKSKEITSLKKVVEEYKDNARLRKEEGDRLKEKHREKEERISTFQKTITDLEERVRRRDCEYTEISEKFSSFKSSSQEQSLEVQELRQINRLLRDQNDEMIRFIKQKQSLEKERRELVENELEEINKFERLLKNIR